MDWLDISLHTIPSVLVAAAFGFAGALAFRVKADLLRIFWLAAAPSALERGAQGAADWMMAPSKPKKGIGKMLRESDNSAMRSVGDYFAVYNSVGTDPKDMTDEEKAAVKRYNE